MTASARRLAVDVGNTAVKVAFYSDSGSLVCRAFPIATSNWVDAIWTGLKLEPAADQFTWLVSSVNRAASSRLKQAVLQAGSPARQIQWLDITHRNVPLPVAVIEPKRLGVDRLLSAYAAFKRFGEPVLVVDAGSAVTVDLVSTDSEGQAIFRGGAILPGISLQYAALRSGAEGLRQTEQTVGKPSNRNTNRLFEPGRNTASAIHAGILASLVGAIERLARDFQLSIQEADSHSKTSSPAEVEIILTGGDGPVISEYMREQHRQCPHLVCRGLLDLDPSAESHPPQ